MEQTKKIYVKIDADVFNYYLYIGDECVFILNHDTRMEERNEDENENGDEGLD